MLVVYLFQIEFQPYNGKMQKFTRHKVQTHLMI